MLLESIKLENFRQFRNESIDFAQGQDGKNVTIIIGENGTGKTTFAQAFFWCMYGETEFSDKNMLNKMVANDLTPGQEASVRVELKLKHGSVAYTLIREQSYKKDYSGRVKGDNTVFNIAIKGADGNTSYVPRSRCESEVKNILPKELSRYFFFDGERIEKMSKDISTGKKATDFAEAVKGLLGLNAMFSAIQHFNPRMRNTVISSYENSYDSHSNAKIQEYTQIIDECNAKIAEIDARLEELEAQIESAQARKAEKTEELKQYAEGEELQRQKEKLLQKIARAKDARGAVIKTICKDFNSGMSSFFSASLMMRTLQFLSEKDFAGKDIPYMHAKTIEYLLKQKVCICGTHLDEGSVPYAKAHRTRSGPDRFFARSSSSVTSFVSASYAAATLPFLSWEKMLSPERLHSAALTEKGISERNTRMFSPTVERSEEIIALALLVRLSTIVSKMPSIFSLGLICRLIFEMERRSRLRPLVDRKFG